MCLACKPTVSSTAVACRCLRARAVDPQPQPDLLPVPGPAQQAEPGRAPALRAVQREEPVAGSGRPHGIRRGAHVRVDHRHCQQRQLREVLLPSAFDWTA